MVLQSEGLALKYVQEPARDKKYCLVAYARLLAEYAQNISQDCGGVLLNALVETASPASKNQGFQIAASVKQGTEEMLMDGAIDQTFAFGRTNFIQLTGAKIEQMDRLTEVANVEQYVMQALQTYCQNSNRQIQQVIKD